MLTLEFCTSTGWAATVHGDSDQHRIPKGNFLPSGPSQQAMVGPTRRAWCWLAWLAGSLPIRWLHCTTGEGINLSLRYNILHLRWFAMCSHTPDKVPETFLNKPKRRRKLLKKCVYKLLSKACNAICFAAASNMKGWCRYDWWLYGDDHNLGIKPWVWQRARFAQFPWYTFFVCHSCHCPVHSHRYLPKTVIKP